MSITDRIIDNNPDKYETIITDRILGKQLQMKLNQYNSLQREYNNLLEKENNNRKPINIEIKKQRCSDNYSGCPDWKNCCPDGTGSNSRITCGPATWMKENCKKTCNTCKHEERLAEPSGYWTDLYDENYQKDMGTGPEESNSDWKFLGKTDDLKECKLKAVHDKESTFSSIVYYPEDIENEWKKSCFGGVSGGKISSSKYQEKVVTSIPPNGSTRLGGEEGEKILKRMKKLQDEIQTLSENVNLHNEDIQNTSSLFKEETIEQEQKLKDIVKQLKRDRLELNKILEKNDYTAEEEDTYIRQTANYTSYGLWILQVAIMFFILYYIYSSESSKISIYIYIILSIWLFILITPIYGSVYGTIASFFSRLWFYILYYLVIPISNLI